MSLKDAEIRAFRASDTPVKKADAKGLYIEVFPNGSKLWRQKYRFAGKEKRLALGAYRTSAGCCGIPCSTIFKKVVPLR